MDELGADDGTEILGSYNYTNIDVDTLGYDNGWVRLELAEYSADVDDDGVIDEDEINLRRDSLSGLTGLPVIGFKVERYINRYVATIGEQIGISNYGGSVDNKGTREIEVPVVD